MKIKSIMFLTSILATNLSFPGIVVNKNIALLSTSMIGPFQKYETVTFQANLKSKANKTSQFNLLIYGSCTSFNKRLIWASQLLNYQPEEIKTFDINLKIPGIDSFGYDLEFVIKNKDNNLVNSLKLTLHDNEPLDIDLNKEQRKIQETYSYAGKIIENKVLKYSETFDFSLMCDSLEAQTYGILPISGIYLEYFGAQKFYSPRVEFSFVDFNHAYTHDFSTFTDRVKIDFQYSQDGTYVFFGPRYNLFVDPNTFQMSFYYYKDYTVRTKKIYLPLNCENKIKDYTFKFEIFDAGVSKSHFVKTFKYVHLKKLIGDCINSDFCVVSNRENG